MGNRWYRQSQTAKPGGATDPVSRQLETAVRDARNAAALNHLVEGKDQSTIDALLKPIIATMAQKITEQMQNGTTPPQSETNAMFKAHLEQRLTMKQLDALDAKDTHGQGPKDVMAFAEGAVNIHKGSAETAMQVAEFERQRRLEVEQDMAGSMQSIRQEEQQKAQQQIDAVEKMQTLVMSMMEKMHTREIEYKDREHQSSVAAIQKAAEDAITKMQSSFQTTQLTSEQLWAKEKELLELKHNHELSKQKSTLPLNADPKYIWEMDHIEWNRKERELEYAERETKRQAQAEMFKTIQENVPEALRTIGQALSGGVSADNPLSQPPSSSPTAAPSPGLGGEPHV